jgi:hypothetical protein
VASHARLYTPPFRPLRIARDGRERLAPTIPSGPRARAHERRRRGARGASQSRPTNSVDSTSKTCQGNLRESCHFFDPEPRVDEDPPPSQATRRPGTRRARRLRAEGPARVTPRARSRRGPAPDVSSTSLSARASPARDRAPRAALRDGPPAVIVGPQNGAVWGRQGRGVRGGTFAGALQEMVPPRAREEEGRSLYAPLPSRSGRTAGRMRTRRPLGARLSPARALPAALATRLRSRAPRLERPTAWHRLADLVWTSFSA